MAIKTIKKYFKNNWIKFAVGLTCLLILTPILLLTFLENQKAAQIGDLVAGFSAAVAFLWLLASFHLQRKELILQRKDIELQRKILTAQTKELMQTSKYNCLNQINSILRSSDERIKASDADANNSTELFKKINSTILELAIYIKSTNANEVNDLYMIWLSRETEVHNFLKAVKVATKLYCETVPEVKIKESNTLYEFIVNNGELISTIPYLSNYHANAVNIANLLTIIAPSIENMHLAGLTASIIVTDFPDAIEANHLKELYAKVSSRGNSPAICSHFDYDDFKILKRMYP